MRTRQMLCCIGLAVLVLAVTMSAGAFDPTAIDFGGETVLLSTRHTNMTPLGPRGQHNWYEIDPRLQAHIEAVEEMFNCKIEFTEPVHESRSPARFAQMYLSGDVEFHYTVIARHRLPTLIAEELLMPLDDVLEPGYYDNFSRLFRYPAESSSMRGQIWGVQVQTWPNPVMGTLFNKDMFEEEGLPSPYDFYDAGEWTYDTVAEITEALIADTTGDGELDRFGLTLEPRLWSQGALVLTNNAAFVREVDGNMVAAINEPEAVAGFEFLVKLLSELEVRTSVGPFTQGNAGMFMGWPHRLQEAAFINAPFAIGFLPLPKGPDADRHVAVCGNMWLGVIPLTTERPREVLEVVNALWHLSEPYLPMDLASWEESYMDEWRRFFHDQETVVHFEWALQNMVYHDFNHEFAQSGFNADARQQMLDGRSVTAVMAEITPAFQGLLDEMYNQ